MSLAARLPSASQHHPRSAPWPSSRQQKKPDYGALVINEFDGLTLYANGSVPVTFDTAPPTANVLHASWGLGGNIGMLAAQVCAFLAVAYASLRLSAFMQWI